MCVCVSLTAIFMRHIVKMADYFLLKASLFKWTPLQLSQVLLARSTHTCMYMHAHTKTQIGVSLAW